MNYESFLASKRIGHAFAGFEPKAKRGSKLFPFQRLIVDRAIRMGRMAVFAECGMGKTLMELEWGRQVAGNTGKPVLLVAPLAVSEQTCGEALRFGYEASFSREPSTGKGPTIQVTNYDNIDKFDPARYSGLILDESSCLKGNGPMRKGIQDFAARIPYRLACTATPAPNDYTELGNHSEFVGNLSAQEMLATYFMHDGGETSKWRLKGHARMDFWRWVASWSVFCSKPSDLGFADDGYNLPDLKYHHHVVGSGFDAGLLFEVEASGLSERRTSRRVSISERCEKAAEIIGSSDQPWLVWCDLNDESELLTNVIEGSVEIRGSNKPEEKVDRLIGFANGKYRRLVTKPSIAGFGMNYQHCSDMIFVGMSDSWEQIYQGVRRCWRFGQKSEVNVHFITSLAEGAVVRNIQRKDAAAATMRNELSEIAKEIYVSKHK